MGRKAFLNKAGASDPGQETFAFENFQGVDVISDNTAMPKYMLPFAKNADFSERIGAAKKRDGITALISSLGRGGCTGIHNYRSASSDRVLFGWGNDLYKLTGTSAALTKTSQADWQAGSPYNIDVSSTPGDMKIQPAPTSNFSRNSEAYKLDGTKVSSGVPRYETAQFGKGILIEGYSSNLDPYPLFTFDPATTGFNASYNEWCLIPSYKTTFTKQSGGAPVGTYYLKLGDGTNGGKGYAPATTFFPGGSRYVTFSFFVRATSTSNRYILLIRLFNSSSVNISSTVTPPTGWSYNTAYDALAITPTNISAANQWKRVSHTIYLPTGVNSLSYSIQVHDGGDKYIDLAGMKYEYQPMMTTFSEGGRLAESFYHSIPSPRVPIDVLMGGIYIPQFNSSTDDAGWGETVLTTLYKNSLEYLCVYFITGKDNPNKGKFAFTKAGMAFDNVTLYSDVVDFTATQKIRWAAANLTKPYGDLSAGMHLWIYRPLHMVDHYSKTDNNVLSDIPWCYLGSFYDNTKHAYGIIDNFYIENVAAREDLGMYNTSSYIENYIIQSNDPYSPTAATVLSYTGNDTLNAEHVLSSSWFSPVYDLGSKPWSGSINWTDTKPANTNCTLQIRSSSDNAKFGAWQSMDKNGNIPLLRYQQVRVNLSSTDVAATPTLSDFTITYESSLNQATSIKSGLSGNKIRFTNYDNKCYWCAGGRLQVFDGTISRDVGTDPPATSPTIAAGAGTGLTGIYKAAVTFVTSDGHESNPSPYSSEINISNKNIAWSNIPVGGARIVKRNLYRTKAGGADYYFVTTINDNVTTAYTDNTADSALVTLMENNNNIPGSAIIVHAHKNYIFYVSSDDPKKLFFSKVANAESYPSTYYKLFPGDIVSVKSYFNYLIVSGHNYTKAVEGSVFGGIADDTVIRDLDDIGALSHEGLADCVDPQLGNVLAYPTPYGIGYITPGIQEKSLSRIPLSKDVQPYFDQAANRQNTAGVFAENRYLVSINSPQSTYNDIVLCYDFRTKKWNGIWTLKASGFCVANRKVYMASSNDGVIYEMFSGTSDAGENINFVLDTIYTPTKYGANYKKKFLQAWISVSDDSVTDTMQLKFKVDNQGGAVQPGSKNGWNVGTWSGDIYGKQNAILSPKLKIPAGKGYYYGVRIEDDSTNPFTVFAIITEFEPPVVGD